MMHLNLTYERTALQLFLPVESHTPNYWRGRDVQIFGEAPDRTFETKEDYLLFVKEVADSVFESASLSYQERWSFFFGIEAFLRYHGSVYTCSNYFRTLSEPNRPLQSEHVYEVIRRYEWLDEIDIQSGSLDALHQLVIEALEILCSRHLSLKDRVTLLEGVEKILDEKRLDWALDLTSFSTFVFGSQIEREFRRHFYHDETRVDTPSFEYIHSIQNIEDEEEVYHVYTPIQEFDDYYYEIELAKLFEYRDDDTVSMHQYDHAEEQRRKRKEKCKELSLSLFPAIEAAPSFWARLFCDMTKEYPYPSKNQIPVASLGYGFELNIASNQSYLTIPSNELLQRRIEELLEREGIIAKVPILSDPAILNDQSFVEAYLDYHIVVSSGSEALHDHYAHVIPTVSLMIDLKETYFREKERIVDCVRRRKEKIERDIREHAICPGDAELLWLALSSVVDRIWNAKRLADLQKVHDEYLVRGSWAVFIDRPNDNRYQAYRSRRFGEKADILHLRYQAIIDRYRLVGYDKKDADFLVVV